MHKIKSPRLSRLDPHITSKAGPNGPHALLKSHLDAFAISSGSLHTDLKRLVERIHPKDVFLINDITVMARLGEFVVNKIRKPLASRLHFISEGGGKTRVIAICDFWSQQILKGIHKKLMGTLRKLKTDGTFSHGLLARQMLKRTAVGGSYCFDLTAATDRMPVKLQELVLAQLFDQETAHL